MTFVSPSATAMTTVSPSSDPFNIFLLALTSASPFPAAPPAFAAISAELLLLVHQPSSASAAAIIYSVITFSSPSQNTVLLYILLVPH
jgi:hypothetical protein